MKKDRNNENCLKIKEDSGLQGTDEKYKKIKSKKESYRFEEKRRKIQKKESKKETGLKRK